MEAVRLVETLATEHPESAVEAALQAIEQSLSDEMLLRLDSALAKIDALPAQLGSRMAEQLASHHPERALSYARRAVEAAPHDASANAILGRLLFELGHVFIAIAPLETAIWQAPEQWRSFLLLARALVTAERPRAALMYLDEVAYRVPERAEDQLELGETYARVGAHHLAVPHLRIAVAAAPKNGPARLIFGTALLADRKLVEAEAALRIASKLGVPLSDIRAKIARTMDPLGSVGTARNALKELEKTGPNETAVAGLLQLLGDDPLDPEEGPEFSGDLLSFAVPEVLDFFYNQRATGMILVRTPLEEARIGIHRGMITGMMVSGRPTLREMLVAESIITDGIAESTLVRAANTDFGPMLVAALIRDGWLTKEELEVPVRNYLVSLLAQISDWRDGRATFAASEPETTPAAIIFDTRRLLLEAAWLVDEAGRAT